MNSTIEILNYLGGRFLNFAWPMLWQSSLLIVVLFAMDFLLRRRIRASIRYALWLVVLVKLCLPPTLALPTSPAWWLPRTRPPAAPPVHYTVTYGTQPLPEISQNPAPVYVAPAPVMTSAVWLLLASGFITVLLLALLLARWRQVAKRVRFSNFSERLTTIQNETRRLAGVTSASPARLAQNTTSPAICGLFRPAILIPQSLAERFSDEQLRAVLLHEMVHLRRRDVWLNCLQALLQIVYWWHPLLWLANVRVRHVREEAVDDAVMLALRDKSDTYAPTLLEVAKLALNRPLASLGLVGILESRSALRQRIERLVNFRAPRKAGLTIASLLGICVFGAVALPMGQAPASAHDEFSAAAASAEKTLTLKVNPKVFIRNIKAKAGWTLDAPTDSWTKILLDIMRSETVDCSPPHGIAFNAKTGEITTRNTPEQLKIFRQVIEQLNRPDGMFEMPDIPRRRVLIEVRFFLMSPDDCEKVVGDLPSERGKNEHTPHWTISPEQFNEINHRIASLNLHPFLRPGVLTADGRPASFSVSDKTNLVVFECVPYEADKGLGNGHKGIALVFRTKMIGGPTGSEQELVGTNQYKASGEVGVEDRGGFIVRTGDPEGSPSNVVMVFRVEMVTNASPAHLGRQQIIKELKRIRLDRFGPIRQPLPQVLRDLQEQITGLVSHDSGIHFLFTDKPDNRLQMVNPNTGLPLDEARTNGVDMNSVLVSIDPPLKNVTLADILDAIVTHVNKPIEYSVLDWGILFSPNNPQASRLFSRTFRVDTNIFLAHLKEQTGVQTNVALALRQLFSMAGVALAPPKAVFYNDRLGMVFVRATQRDLDAVEKIVVRLNGNQLAPQIHIKARFVKVPKGTLNGFRKMLGVTNQTNKFVGIMTESQFQAALHALKRDYGVTELAAPQVTTFSGRQTQMRATRIITVITNFVYQQGASGTNAIVPLAGKFKQVRYWIQSQLLCPTVTRLI